MYTVYNIDRKGKNNFNPFSFWLQYLHFPWKILLLPQSSPSLYTLIRIITPVIKTNYSNLKFYLLPCSVVRICTEWYSRSTPDTHSCSMAVVLSMLWSAAALQWTLFFLKLLLFLKYIYIYHQDYIYIYI